MIYYGCPKCGAAMSSPDSVVGKTDTCPECGNVSSVPTPAEAPTSEPAPRGSSYAPVHAGQVTTIERTSKRLKGHLLIAWIMVFVGIGLVWAGWPAASGGESGNTFLAGILVFVVGVIAGIVTRVRIWWRHA